MKKQANKQISKQPKTTYMAPSQTTLGGGDHKKPRHINGRRCPQTPTIGENCVVAVVVFAAAGVCLFVSFVFLAWHLLKLLLLFLSSSSSSSSSSSASRVCVCVCWCLLAVSLLGVFQGL